VTCKGVHVSAVCLQTRFSNSSNSCEQGEMNPLQFLSDLIASNYSRFQFFIDFKALHSVSYDPDFRITFAGEKKDGPHGNADDDDSVPLWVIISTPLLAFLVVVITIVLVLISFHRTKARSKTGGQAFFLFLSFFKDFRNGEICVNK